MKEGREGGRTIVRSARTLVRDWVGEDDEEGEEEEQEGRRVEEAHDRFLDGGWGEKDGVRCWRVRKWEVELTRLRTGGTGLERGGEGWSGQVVA